MESTGHAVLALQDRSEVGCDYLISSNVQPNEATQRWLVRTKSLVRHVPSLADYPHEQTMRVGICAPVEECVEIAKQLTGRFGSRIFCQNLLVPTTQVHVLEVFDPAVNKWQGVLYVARRHGMRGEQIIAIGDDVNDISMLQGAGLGVAMGNASREVQGVAKRVIRSNEEDGLAEFLEEVVASRGVEGLKETDRVA